MPRLSGASSAVRSWFEPVLEFCFPRQCAACAVAFETPGMLCPTCEPLLQQLLTASACHRCAMPAPFDETCPHCLGKGVRPFDRIASLGVLKQPLQSVIHAIKYRNRWPLAEWLADVARDQTTVQRVLAEADVLVPVPLFPARQVARGYNQSEVIARRLGTLMKVAVTPAADRVRDTPPQAQLKARQKRFDNLRGAFVITQPERICGKHVVVIDDVMTTGATLGVFGRALLTAEPASLSAFVIAVADPKGRQFEVI